MVVSAQRRVAASTERIPTKRLPQSQSASAGSGAHQARSALRRLAQHVTGAAHGMEQARLSPRLHLRAQVADIHFEHVRLALEVVAPYAVHDDIPCQDLARPPHEELQQLVFGGGEVELARRATRLPVSSSRSSKRSTSVCSGLRRRSSARTRASSSSSSIGLTR